MEDSDQEVKHAERLCIKLEDVNYDIIAIEMMQDAMHEPFDEMCRDIALFHHERWDGGATAYPGAFDYKNFVIGSPVIVEKHIKSKKSVFCFDNFIIILQKI